MVVNIGTTALVTWATGGNIILAVKVGNAAAALTLAIVVPPTVLAGNSRRPRVTVGAEIQY